MGRGLLGSTRKMRIAAVILHHLHQPTSFNGIVEVATVPETVEHRREEVCQVALREHPGGHFLRGLVVFVDHFPLLLLTSLLRTENTTAHGYLAVRCFPNTESSEWKNLDTYLYQKMDSKESEWFKIFIQEFNEFQQLLDIDFKKEMELKGRLIS